MYIYIYVIYIHVSKLVLGILNLESHWKTTVVPILQVSNTYFCNQECAPVCSHMHLICNPPSSQPFEKAFFNPVMKTCEVLEQLERFLELVKIDDSQESFLWILQP